MTNQQPNHSAGAGSTYRAYLFGQSGRIASAVEVQAGSDDDAMRQTRTIDHAGKIELWDRSRVVARYAQGEHGLTDQL